MDALILAAGLGSRLQEAEPCKPLAKLGGLSLIEISVRQLQSVGATRIVVATGYQAALVEAELQAISKRLDISIEAYRVQDFTQPNGHSILAAKAALHEQFLLVMADHIFDAAILRALATEPAPDSGVVLATDRRLESELIDPADVTWVESDPHGRIVRIGKQIPAYDAADCGAFRATSALIRAIETAIAKGLPGSLSDGMQELADQNKAWTRDIGSAWWIDVDDPHFLDLARKQIGLHLPHLFEAGLTLSDDYEILERSA